MDRQLLLLKLIDRKRKWIRNKTKLRDGRENEMITHGTGIINRRPSEEADEGIRFKQGIVEKDWRHLCPMIDQRRMIRSRKPLNLAVRNRHYTLGSFYVGELIRSPQLVT